MDRQLSARSSTRSSAVTTAPGLRSRYSASVGLFRFFIVSRSTQLWDRREIPDHHFNCDKLIGVWAAGFHTKHKPIAHVCLTALLFPVKYVCWETPHSQFCKTYPCREICDGWERGTPRVGLKRWAKPHRPP